MMRSSILWASVGLLVLGCNRFNSEFEAPDPVLEVVQRKPQCTFQTANNCWQNEIRALQECVRASQMEGPDTFLEGRDGCTNDNGRNIIFSKNETLFDQNLAAFEKDIEFKVWSHNQECFTFQSLANGFTIISPDSGQMSFKKDGEGNVNLRCVDGEEIVISAEVLQQGCEEWPAQKGTLEPGFAWAYSFDKDQRESWSFQIVGLGASPAPLFQCQDPEI